MSKSLTNRNRALPNHTVNECRPTHPLHCQRILARVNTHTNMACTDTRPTHFPSLFEQTRLVACGRWARRITLVRGSNRDWKRQLRR
ncbi:hypothetical protein BCR44DRAFT_1439163 [Catenaria anguillulae PL171]|uniref:Uncharacterized protein n=1 Tax=Catenaria anguillulae PL171 TaxID=765915 RepID=A0A1Y2HGC3_9FUNG|nr:hypothetical protein BCR44DRAFT_1439163 [Catenaria anguillulae PL171]